jgi:hypothetical protein
MEAVPVGMNGSHPALQAEVLPVLIGSMMERGAWYPCSPL